MAGRRGLNGRQRLIEAAFELFASQGFDRTSSREIAARSGVALGLIHKHFGSMDQLIQATDQHVIEWSRQRLQQSLQLLAGSKTSRGHLLPAADQLALSYVKMSIFGRAHGSRDVYMAVLAASRQILEQLQQSGRIRSDISADAGAQFLLFLEIGAMTVMPMHGSGKSLPFPRDEIMTLAEDALRARPRPRKRKSTVKD